MGEHRVDQLAARNRPMPRPLTEPIEILTPHAAGAAAHRRPRRHRWKRQITHAMRSRRGRWVLIGLACAVVLIVGLIAQGFLSSAAPAASVRAGDGGYSTPAPAPLASKSAGKHHDGTPGNGLVGNPMQQLRNVLPDNPLNHLNTHELHQVTVSASAPGRIAVLGYLIPTGLGSAYGVVHTNSHSWSVSEQALGGGYLAAIFIQTGKDGTPLTCTITVDGKVTSSQTTSGSYGRAVCLG